MAKRLQAMNNRRYHNGFDVTLHNDLITRPMMRKRPRMIFVNSMSDLFHEQIPFEFITQVFNTMNLAYWHTFQILTKRSERLLEFAPKLNWSKNIWIGVTVENQICAKRIADLRQVPAAIRFLSCEPLIESICLDLRDIHWVIVGGESGPHARPMDQNWVRSIREQCQMADVPFFLKQLGGRINKRGHDEALLDGHLIKEWPIRANSTNDFAPTENELCSTMIS
jgi:protein gp37